MAITGETTVNANSRSEIATRSWKQAAREHGVTDVDALLIALNLYGLSTPLGARVRLQLSVPVGAAARTVSVAAGRVTSPFTLSDDGVLAVNGEPVGCAVRTDVDDAVSGYLRNWDNQRGGWRAATINPASRSRCTGCLPCPTALEPPADPYVNTQEQLHALLDGLLRQLPYGGSLRDLDEVAVSTRCYGTEDAAVDAMLMLRKVLRARRMNARIMLLSSVVRSREAFRYLAENVGPFGLFLTADCVSRRSLLLKDTKADLSPEAMPDLLADARAAGLDTSFTYIVGLDAPADMEWFFRAMLPQVTLFPSIQVMQSHSPVNDHLAHPDAAELAYFLDARRLVEDIMGGLASPLLPEPWRCYRSLWSETYAGQPLPGARR